MILPLTGVFLLKFLTAGRESFGGYAKQAYKRQLLKAAVEAPASSRRDTMEDERILTNRNIISQNSRETQSNRNPTQTVGMKNEELSTQTGGYVPQMDTHSTQNTGLSSLTQTERNFTPRDIEYTGVNVEKNGMQHRESLHTEAIREKNDNILQETASSARQKYPNDMSAHDFEFNGKEQASSSRQKYPNDMSAHDFEFNGKPFMRRVSLAQTLSKSIVTWEFTSSSFKDTVQ
ncbi:uncharacterized protein LOC117344090 [Pecten maximus]|uniref:uncharacterized protein LOC117344090 n=1 Tax=Pecten maximus TaxID=6579 RepID=UPI0014581800|nr:uncharacterized protein LOC117344090 [Pecten maximus]